MDVSTEQQSTRPIHVIVVAFHAALALEHCLGSLGGSLPVLVVDNSSDPDVRAVSGRSGASYVDARCNRGFGAGVNLGLRRILRGPPTDVLLLNPDAQFSARQAESLASRFQQPGWDRVGTVAPRVVDLDGSEQRVMWPFPSPFRAWVEAAGAGRLNRQRDFAIGAVLLLRWEALLDVGLFDERFFLYAEEADWQRRAAGMGWQARASVEEEACHEGAGTSRTRGIGRSCFTPVVRPISASGLVHGAGRSTGQRS